MAAMQTALEVSQPGKWVGGNYLLVAAILELEMSALQEAVSPADPGPTDLVVGKESVDLQNYPS